MSTLLLGSATWQSLCTPESDDSAPDREDALLANADTFTDWLGGGCLCVTDAQVPMHLPRHDGSLQLYIDNASHSALAVLVIHHRADVRAAAGLELRNRYLKGML